MEKKRWVYFSLFLCRGCCIFTLMHLTSLFWRLLIVIQTDNDSQRLDEQEHPYTIHICLCLVVSSLINIPRCFDKWDEYNWNSFYYVWQKYALYIVYGNVLYLSFAITARKVFFHWRQNFCWFHKLVCGLTFLFYYQVSAVIKSKFFDWKGL